MSAVPDESIPGRDLKPTIGTEVLLSREALLGGHHAAGLRALLEARGVLVFPEIGFTREEQIAFTRTLGDYAPDKADGLSTPISIDKSRGTTADYTRSAFFWHFDGYMNDVPILASILCAEVLSPAGGETEFSNTYAAYEELPDERKAQLEGLRAVHSLAAAQLSVLPEPDYASFQQWLRVPRNTLPLVWKHRSGRKSLVIGNTASHIVGMDPLESRELLIWLRDWATRERFCYRHTWSVGDAVIWDNTGTLHRVTPYPADSGRLMHRTKLAGEEPVE